MDIFKEIKRLRKRIEFYDSSAAEHIFRGGILDILLELNEKNEAIQRKASHYIGSLSERVYDLEHPPDKASPELELKPCPLCGSRDIRNRKAIDKTAYLCCLRCGANCGCFKTISEAQENWNRRQG